MDDVTSWSRQVEEPIRWFSRFELFRLMGPDRSLFGSYKRYLVNIGKERSSPPTAPPLSWRTNSVKWEWKKRAEEWDMEEHRKLLAAAAKESAAMLERHKAWARTLQGVGGARIALIPKDGAGHLLPAKMGLGEARHYIKDGITMERTAAGLPAEMFEVMQLSDDELAAKYRDLLTAIGGAAVGDGEAGVEASSDEEQPVQAVPGEVS